MSSEHLIASSIMNHDFGEGGIGFAVLGNNFFVGLLVVWWFGG